MGKITKDELIKRIDEIETHLLKKLDLKNTLNDVELALFYESFIPWQQPHIL